MSKELEALEFICKILKEKGIDIKWLFKEQYNTIKQRLESIDNAEPSEALEDLENLRCNLYNEAYLDKYALDDCNTIKQALLKAKELEEVLEILKSKDVLYTQIKYCKSVDEYNHLIEFTDFDNLAEEEFELLKRYFEKNIQK